jgi:hypothetical protein
MPKQRLSDIHREEGALHSRFSYHSASTIRFEGSLPMSRLSTVIRMLARRAPHWRIPPVSAHKPSLLLHIGPHKTGTTAIQLFCERNRNELAKAGFWYPKAGLASGQHMVLPGCYISHHPHIPASLLGGSPEKIVADIAAEVPRGLTPVMSSEVYWELLCNQPDAFESVLELLRRRYDVHIVMVERPVVERVWSAIKFKSRLGFAFDPIAEFGVLQGVACRALERLERTDCSVIRVPYDDADCISPFLRSVSSHLAQRQPARPRILGALIERCRAASSKLRENVSPSEPWFVAVTLEFSRRLMAAKESSGKYHSRIAAFWRDVMAIGNGLESIRLLPDEDAVFHRVVEASNTRAGLLTPVEVRVWEAICGHPTIQKLAIRTGCAGELMAVCQPGFRSRNAA